MRLAVIVALLASACGRVGFDALDDQFVPAHLGERPPRGSASLVLHDSIDTTELLVDGVAPAAGVMFSTWPQPGGPELAVLVAGDVTVPIGSTIRVTGSRPLVIVAEAMLIDGALDAGAHGATPGPGGGGSGEGAGAGASTEKPTPDVCDPGAGGGGFAHAGAPGGVDSCGGTPGAGGAAYADASLAVLTGGSGGGVASPGECSPGPGGAGGGAIQLTAYEALSITGGISAGGGGGGVVVRSVGD